MRRLKGEQIQNVNSANPTPTKYHRLLNLLKNIEANRLAISRSRFGWPNVIKGIPGSRYYQGWENELRKRAQEIIPQYDRSLLPAVIQKPVNFFPYRKYDFVGKDRTTYDTNFAYRQAQSTPTGMDFFAPVTSEQAAAFREEDADKKQRKENRYQYLRRQVTRRKEIFDQYKWLKPIAKANPTIAKNLPKIAKRLDSIASIPGMEKYVKNPMTLAASALGAFVRGYASSLKAMSAMNKRSILERFYGKPTSEATLFASGMNYEDAIKSSGKFAALSSRLQRGIGTELFELAGIYGVPELAIWGDPLVSIDEKKRVTQQAVKRLPEGDRINILSAYGITPEEYNAASLQGKSLKDLTPAQKGDLYAGIADKYMKEAASRNWFSSLLYTSGASDFIARDLAKDEYGSLMQFLFGGKTADEGRYVLAKEAELTLGTKTMRNAELAAQSLNDSNIRAADADIAAMTNYSMTERPVTVVIQGDIRTDADNGQRLFDDIDKRYNLGSLTEIAEPVAKSFDSKIKR